MPDLLYDDLEPGRRFKDTVMTITPEMVRKYALAVDNAALLAQADLPDGTPLDDPSLLILFATTRRVLAQDGRVPGAGILARMDIAPERSPRMGESIRTRTSIGDRYEKRGRRTILLRCDFVDDAGGSLGYSESHIIWPR